MHATIVLSGNIQRVLQYHELKVRRGQAELIGADNFIKDMPELSYTDKVYHFDRLMSLNEQAWKPVLHVFLGFNRQDPIGNDTMQRIAQEYIEGMGYGQQPWLVYRHYDALHAHAHLVSTTIGPEGKRIRLTRAGLTYSRELTHGLERKYSLDTSNEEIALRAQHSYLQQVQYGKASLYPAMKLVLETIIPEYRYTSLDELNAVLGLFNVKASRGKEGSMTYQHRGIVYYPLREDGRVGDICIRASAFPSRPTLDELEKRFAENLGIREGYSRRITSSIDYALAGSRLSFTAFRQAMGREKISVIAPSEPGGSPGIWYVDHTTRAVFEGEALGSRYTAVVVRERCLPEETYQQQQTLQLQEETERHRHRMHHSH